MLKIQLFLPALPSALVIPLAPESKTYSAHLALSQSQLQNLGSVLRQTYVTKLSAIRGVSPAVTFQNCPQETRLKGC